MNFIFICPNHHKSFESADFQILENRGVVIGASGEKTLDAKVALNNPCPICGEKHVYQAADLACPFGA